MLGFILNIVLTISLIHGEDRSKEDISFISGNLTLSGTVLLPKAEGPFPAVVFLHGSGSATRDQNMWRAKKFAKEGYLSLIFDKRGTGKSEGTENDWRYFSFDSLAQDATAAVEYLRSRTDIDRSRIGLVAASQSGWVAPIAASKSNDIAFLVIISASVSTVAEDRLFERAARLRKEGFTNEEVAEATLMQKLDQEVTRNSSRFPEFEEMWMANKNKNWFSRVYLSDYFIQDPESNEYRKWYKDIIDYDPIPYIKQINQPTLWLFGDSELDRFGPVEQSLHRLESLKTQKSNFQLIQYNGADHNLNGAKYLEDIFSWLNDIR